MNKLKNIVFWCSLPFTLVLVVVFCILEVLCQVGIEKLQAREIFCLGSPK